MPDTDPDSDVISMLYSSVNSAPKPVYPFVRWFGIHHEHHSYKAGGSQLIYNQRQCFTCFRQQRAMTLRCWYVPDCQEWAKWPLAASGARWMNIKGGWNGRGGRRRVKLIVVVGSGHAKKSQHRLQTSTSFSFIPQAKTYHNIKDWP